MDRKIYLEDADRPPPSYYQEKGEESPRRKPFQTPRPEEWLKAKEFVPRTRLEESFDNPEERSWEQERDRQRDGINSVPFVPSMSAPHLYNNALHHHPYPSPFPLGPTGLPALPGIPGIPPMTMTPQAVRHPTLGGAQFNNQKNQQLQNNINMSFVPNGYSANITHINAGIGGAPIPAIVLRKKRRKRNRHAHSMALNSSESPCSSHPIDPNGEGSGTQTPEGKIDDSLERQNVLGGSCPDLSEEQLELWDNYLYDAAVGSKREDVEEEPPGVEMKTSIYEIVPQSILDVAEEAVTGISNPEIRKLEKEINGNTMTSSQLMRTFAERNPRVDADGSTEKSLATELGQLNFRPELSKYGYPQIDAPTVHMTTFHHDNVHSKIVSRSLITDSDEERFEEDCFEGMNITMNAFDQCDDLTLSDVEGSATRFEQIHQALKRNSKKYAVDLRPPDRVCCVLM